MCKSKQGNNFIWPFYYYSSMFCAPHGTSPGSWLQDSNILSEQMISCVYVWEKGIIRFLTCQPQQTSPHICEKDRDLHCWYSIYMSEPLSVGIPLLLLIGLRVTTVLAVKWYTSLGIRESLALGGRILSQHRVSDVRTATILSISLLSVLSPFSAALCVL